MREKLLMAGLCLVLVVVSLAAAVWTVLAGLGLTMDTLLLIGICLMIALIFGVNFFSLIREAGLLRIGKRQ